MNYVQLHTHSDYSPQDGGCTARSIAKKAAELEMPAVALTDHGRCGGLLQFKKACEEYKVKPIFGCELYVSPKDRFLKERIEGHNTSYHMTVLAKTQEGLKNLFRLSSIGWLDGFYYKPRVDLDVLNIHKEGLIVLSGCSSGRVANRFLEDKHDESIEYAKTLRKIWGDDFYLEVQNHGMSWQQPLKRWLFNMSHELSIPIVATQDSHFINHKDATLHQKICKLAAGDLEFGTTEMYFKSYDEMCERFDKNEQSALLETLDVAEKCNVDWQYGQTIWPKIRPFLRQEPDEELSLKAKDGLERLFREGNETYHERLAMELSLIKKMGFSSYFLVVADFIDWARKNKISVGPGRGSGCGSLVCYCLGITEVDPIKYGLFFERFLNPDRVSLPDLDIDFCPRGRKDVMSYVSHKYGYDKVAQIGTYSQFKPRGALRDFARVCGYEPSIGAKLAELIPPDIAGKPLTFDEAIKAEPKLSKTQWPEVVDLAQQAEGLRTKAGVHAAGVVISDSELKSQVPLFRGRNDEVATQFDMHDVEEIGLVKYDFLGLINLTIIQDAISLIKERKGIDIDITTIPEDDQEVFSNVFQTGKLDGVFQFETSSGFRDLCIRVRPRSIKDLSVVTSLYRPGPLQTGLLNKYITGRNGRQSEYLTPELKPILQETYGIMVYQEQIMRICTDLAGYTASEADNMRKIIGKKIVDKMTEEREKFTEGCLQNGIQKQVASKLFDDIEGFAKYSFNLSHAIAYSIISYRTAWLKYYYPEEFYCSLLNNTIKEQDQLVKYIYSCKESGIAVEPPNINRSNALFSIDNGTILFGLGGIKGIGEKTCNAILEKKEAGFENISDIITAGATAKDIKLLALAGALEEITEHNRLCVSSIIDELVGYHKKKANWEQRKKRIEEREKDINIAISQGHKPPRRLPKLPNPPVEPKIEFHEELTKEHLLALEREKLGYYLSGHPMDSCPELYRLTECTLEQALNEKSNGNIATFPGVIGSLTKKRTRKGKNMAILTIEDKFARIEAVVFPKVWESFGENLQHACEETLPGIFTCKVTKDENIYEGTQVTRLIVSKFTSITDPGIKNMQKIEDLQMSLRDGSIVNFITDNKTPRKGWQHAIAIIHNQENRT